MTSDQIKELQDFKKTEELKAKIIKLFKENVRGRKSDSSKSNINHDGKDGHWLERQMGVAANGKNEPDLFGFEMKNDTSSKTTFGDWSASYYIFKDKEYNITRDEFMIIFGAPNILKENRYSWSGKPIPKIDTYNTFGQILKVDNIGNIKIEYSFKKDERPSKNNIVPILMQKNNLIIASWSVEKIQKKVENKFNKLGWFKCVKNSEKVYSKIVFGAPITFSNWIKAVRNGDIFFDSGMYQGNKRPYSQWRADNKYWESLVVERY